MKIQMSVIIGLIALIGRSAVAAPLSLETDLEGVRSPYTAAVLKVGLAFLREGAPALNTGLPNAALPGGVTLRCWKTPGNDFYIGIEQGMEINAPLDRVASVLDDINHYSELFPDYESIKTISRIENRLETLWEQEIPLFFVPNVKYEVSYLVDTSIPGRRVYRYQLHKPSKLKSNDGIILLEKRNDGSTFYHEYDFFDADWGIAKLVGETKIWQDATRGITLSDLAIRFKAENPAWTNEQARTESRHRLDMKKVKECVENRALFSAP